MNTNLIIKTEPRMNVAPYEYRERHSYFNNQPSERDYAETRELLHDFGVKDSYTIPIPKFDNRNELLRWRLDKIKKLLD